MRRYLPVLLLAAMAGHAAAQTPQDSARAALDSLTERLERAEHRIERLQAAIEEQAQSKVQSRLRNRLEISGLILLNGYYNNAKVNSSDIPTFAAQLVPADSASQNFAAAQLTQSRLGFTVSGSRVLGAGLTADLQLDFYGGQQSSAAHTFPIPRIRTAFVKLDWPHFGLLVGQESQIISPLNPHSFASVGIPGFTNAGNLWFWVPQVRFGWETGARTRFGIQAAVLAPTLANAQTPFATSPDTTGRTRRPMVQGRMYFGWGDGDTESEIGFGIHRGWISTPSNTTATSEAYSADLRLAFGEHIQLLGEAFFNGQALAGLGGGGIGQEFGTNGAPVKTKGGWAQLNIRPRGVWEFGFGAGMDDPDESNLPVTTGRGRNLVYEGHVHVRPGGGLLMGLEFRRMDTLYNSGSLVANHLNGFVGVAF